MRKILFVVLVILMAIIPAHATTIGSATITATGSFTLQDGQTLTMAAQLIGCGQNVPLYQGSPISNTPNQPPQFSADDSQAVSFTLPGNDQITCATQSYTLYAITWNINGYAAAPTRAYRFVDGQSYNLNTMTPIDFVPPVINNGAGSQCSPGTILNGYDLNYNPICTSFIASSVAPPNYAVQFNSGTGLGGDSNFLFNPTLHALTVPSINNLTNLASQAGSTVPEKFNAWIASTISSGQRSILWIDPLAGTGDPTSALTSLNRIIDTRGTECHDQTGGLFYADNSICFEAFETSQDSTTAATDKATIHIGYSSLNGGVYNYNTSSGTKSNRMPLFITGAYRTASQNWGIYEKLGSYVGGEIIPFSALVEADGGYIGTGEEPNEGVRIQQYQGSESDSAGGMFNGTITGISSGTVTFTPVANLQTLGETRFIRDLNTKYNTGTIASVACSGNPSTCTVTGSGTSWTSIPGFVGTHTTFNGLSTGGPILTNNLVLCFDPNSNDGYDWCVPITTGVNDTSLTVNLYDIQTAQNTTWYGATSGTYAIYGSAYPTNVNLNTDTLSAADVSGLTSGDTIDQVMGYNGNFRGMLVLQYRAIGRPNFGGGIEVENYGDASSPQFGPGFDVVGSYLAGLELEPQGSVGQGYGIYARVRPAGAMIFDDAPASTTPFNFYEYFRSDSHLVVPIQIDPNIADPFEGMSFYQGAMTVSSQGKGVSIPLMNSNTQLNGSVYQQAAGVFGTYQNLAKYSQFDSGNASWTQLCGSGGAVTVTANTGDTTDPFGGSTAEKIVAPGTLCATGYSGQQQAISGLTTNTAYTGSIWMRGPVGCTTNCGIAVFGVAIGGTLDTTVNLTNSWVRYTISGFSASTITQGFVIRTPVASQVLYVFGAQTEQSTSAGYYIQTEGSAISPTTGLVAATIRDLDLAPSATAVCTDAANNLTTSGCVPTPKQSEDLIITSGICTTTGSEGLNGACVMSAVSWGTAFADTNYTVTCQPFEPSSSGDNASVFVYINAKTASTITLSLENGSNSAAKASTTSEIDCHGSHL